MRRFVYKMNVMRKAFLIVDLLLSSIYIDIHVYKLNTLYVFGGTFTSYYKGKDIF